MKAGRSEFTVGEVLRGYARHRDLGGRALILGACSYLAGQELFRAARSSFDLLREIARNRNELERRLLAERVPPQPPDGREPMPAADDDELAAARERLEHDAADVEDALAGVEVGDVTPLRPAMEA